MSRAVISNRSLTSVAVVTVGSGFARPLLQHHVPRWRRTVRVSRWCHAQGRRALRAALTRVQHTRTHSLASTLARCVPPLCVFDCQYSLSPPPPPPPLGPFRLHALSDQPLASERCRVETLRPHQDQPLYLKITRDLPSLFFISNLTLELKARLKTTAPPHKAPQ